MDREKEGEFFFLRLSLSPSRPSDLARPFLFFLSPLLPLAQSPPHLELPQLRELLVERALRRGLRDDLVHAAGDRGELFAHSILLGIQQKQKRARER